MFRKIITKFEKIDRISEVVITLHVVLLIALLYLFILMNLNPSNLIAFIGKVIAVIFIPIHVTKHLIVRLWLITTIETMFVIPSVMYFLVM